MIPALINQLMATHYFTHESEAALFVAMVLDHDQPTTAQQVWVQTDESGLCPHCVMLTISRVGVDGPRGLLHEIGCPAETDDVERDRLTDLLERKTGNVTESARAAFEAVRARRKPLPPHARRNDPCPCGSGHRYKHCCGR